MTDLQRNNRQAVKDMFCHIEPALGVPLETLAAEGRQNAVPRQVAMYVLRQALPKNISSSTIARILNRDHTTLFTSIRRVKDMLDTKDTEYTNLYNNAIMALKQKEVKTELQVELTATEVQDLDEMVTRFLNLNDFATSLSALLWVIANHVCNSIFPRQLVIDKRKPNKIYMLRLTPPEAVGLAMFLTQYEMKTDQYGQGLIRRIVWQIDQSNANSVTENILSPYVQNLIG